MRKHDVVREVFKNNFGAIAWNEFTGGVSRRLKNHHGFWGYSDENVDAFKAELDGNGIDTSLVTVKLGFYTTVLYPATWFEETV